MTMNVMPIEELIKILKATRNDLMYADSTEDQHYTLNTMAEDIDRTLQDLVAGIGGEPSAFYNCNTVAMEVALSSVEFDELFDTRGEVELLDEDFDSW
jgi:hypothetical protein